MPRWPPPDERREQIVAAMREWADIFGEAPSSPDWNATLRHRHASREERYRSTGRSWPSTPTVLRWFGTWAAALKAAGLKPAKRLQRTHCRNGHRLTPHNTFTWNGHRYCAICRMRANQRQRAARAAQRDRIVTLAHEDPLVAELLRRLQPQFHRNVRASLMLHNGETIMRLSGKLTRVPVLPLKGSQAPRGLRVVIGAGRFPIDAIEGVTPLVFDEDRVGVAVELATHRLLIHWPREEGP